jgi:hypothetical protein
MKKVGMGMQAACCTFHPDDITRTDATPLPLPSPDTSLSEGFCVY